MKDQKKTKEQLVKELAELRQRVAELGVVDTERKRAEEQIRYQSLLVENVSDAIFSTDINFNILSWNKAAENLYGWRADEVIGKPAGEVVPAECVHHTREEVQIQLREEGYWQGEAAHKRKDGTPINVLASANLLTDSTGNVVGAVAIIHDISERRQAEEALRESEERARALFKGIPIPTATWQKVDDDFVFIDYNDANYQISQGKLVNFVGKTAKEIYPDMPEIIEDLSRCFNEKTTINRELDYLLRSTGETKYMAFTYGFVPPDLVMLHAGDITERKRTEEALAQRVEELESFHRLTVGRELRMIELKRQVNELSEQLRKETPYDLALLE